MRYTISIYFLLPIKLPMNLWHWVTFFRKRRVVVNRGNLHIYVVHISCVNLSASTFERRHFMAAFCRKVCSEAKVRRINYINSKIQKEKYKYECFVMRCSHSMKSSSNMMTSLLTATFDVRSQCCRLRFLVLYLFTSVFFP